MKPLALSLLAALAVGASAQPLYGVGRSVPGAAMYGFYQINTTTGAATQLFSFNVANTTGVNFLTYNPVVNRFVTVGAVSANQAVLVEIDHVAQTAAAVTHGIPNAFFEGLEYMPSLGGLVVSHGPGGFFTGNIALLNPTTYGLISSQAIPGAPDSDVLFADGAGQLNVLDPNNLNSSGFHRNVINNPFGAVSVTGVPNNTFNPLGGEPDLHYKVDEGRLFLTQVSQLSTVGPLNGITTVGSYGTHASGAPINITGISAVPEPATMTALGAGLLLLARRRRSR